MGSPLSAENALSDYRMMLHFVAEEPELTQFMAEPAGSPCAYVWLPHWLPIVSDLCGETLFLDLRPGRRSGCVGVHLKDQWQYDGPKWPSVAALLSELAVALTNRTEMDGFGPVIEDGRLTWDC
jgi:cell wall assembly regulator SMI1